VAFCESVVIHSNQYSGSYPEYCRFNYLELLVSGLPAMRSRLNFMARRSLR
jgi:hypothetical protein